MEHCAIIVRALHPSTTKATFYLQAHRYYPKSINLALVVFAPFQDVCISKSAFHCGIQIWLMWIANGSVSWL